MASPDLIPKFQLFGPDEAIHLSDLFDYVPASAYPHVIDYVAILIWQPEDASIFGADAIETSQGGDAYRFFIEGPPANENYGTSTQPYGLFNDGEVVVTGENPSFMYTFSWGYLTDPSNPGSTYNPGFVDSISIEQYDCEDARRGLEKLKVPLFKLENLQNLRDQYELDVREILYDAKNDLATAADIRGIIRAGDILVGKTDKLAGSIFNLYIDLGKIAASDAYTDKQALSVITDMVAIAWDGSSRLSTDICFCRRAHRS